MKLATASASSQVSDPYRAGFAIGEALAASAPEVVFLFGSVQYGRSGEVLEGLYDALERPNPVVIGNSGDGFYETGFAADSGIAGLGISTGGAVRWRVVSAPGASKSPAESTRACLKQLEVASGGARPAFLMLFSDFRTDASLIERVLRDEVDVPVVGGLAGDDNRHTDCHLYANRQVLRDSIVMLGAYGPIAFHVAIGNALHPVGRPGVVEVTEGPRIDRISGLTATEFVATETGKPVLQTDRGIVALRVSDPTRPGEHRLRSIVPALSPSEESLGVYGSVERGDTVQVCLASPEELVAEVYQIADRARRLDFEPRAAVVVSCAGRKWLLGGRIEHEVRALARAFPGGLPLVGFPSFGEFGPVAYDAGTARNFFHNMTFVLLLLGEPTPRSSS